MFLFYFVFSSYKMTVLCFESVPLSKTAEVFHVHSTVAM